MPPSTSEPPSVERCEWSDEKPRPSDATLTGTKRPACAGRACAGPVASSLLDVSLPSERYGARRAAAAAVRWAAAVRAAVIPLSGGGAAAAAVSGVEYGAAPASSGGNAGRAATEASAKRAARSASACERMASSFASEQKRWPSAYSLSCAVGGGVRRAGRGREARRARARPRRPRRGTKAGAHRRRQPDRTLLVVLLQDLDDGGAVELRVLLQPPRLVDDRCERLEDCLALGRRRRRRWRAAAGRHCRAQLAQFRRERRQPRQEALLLHAVELVDHLDRVHDRRVEGALDAGKFGAAAALERAELLLQLLVREVRVVPRRVELGGERLGELHRCAAALVVRSSSPSERRTDALHCAALVVRSSTRRRPRGPRASAARVAVHAAQPAGAATPADHSAARSSSSHSSAQQPQQLQQPQQPHICAPWRSRRRRRRPRRTRRPSG